MTYEIDDLAQAIGDISGGGGSLELEEGEYDPADLVFVDGALEDEDIEANIFHGAEPFATARAYESIMDAGLYPGTFPVVTLPLASVSNGGVANVPVDTGEVANWAQNSKWGGYWTIMRAIATGLVAITHFYFCFCLVGWTMGSKTW